MQHKNAESFMNQTEELVLNIVASHSCTVKHYSARFTASNNVEVQTALTL